MGMILWHNPRCSKSRATLALLEDRGLAPEIRLYLQDPPGMDELRAAQAALGTPLLTMVRVKETRFGELGLSPESDEATLLAAMAENPILIERPILITPAGAAIGRPPEAILALL